ncbi:MAG: PDZ domain-containing protein [Planctomycetes bacterium]|nr:PDZ domain-containing protein [Planctomycetota bacterium]
MKTPFVARLALATLCTGTLASTVPAQQATLHEDSQTFTQPRARAAAPAPADDRPRLGVMVSDTPEGVLVESVLDDSLAASAGLQQGDIILSVEGERLGDYTDIGRILGRLAPGATCAISVIRDGAGLVKLEGTVPEPKQADAPQQPALADGHKGGFLGVELGDSAEHGVAVAGVIDGSAAWFAGLQEGDVLTSIDGEDVATGEDVAGAISSRAPGTLVALGFLRGDDQQTTHVRLGHRAPPPFGDLGNFSVQTPDSDDWQFGGQNPLGQFFGNGGQGGVLVMPRGQGMPFVWQGIDDLHDHLQQMFPGVDLDADGAHEMKIEIKDGVMTIERDGKVETHQLDQGQGGQGMHFRAGPHGGMKVVPAPDAPAPRVKGTIKGTAGTQGTLGAQTSSSAVAVVPVEGDGAGSGCGGGAAACGDGSSCGGGKTTDAACPAAKDCPATRTEAKADTPAPGVN